MQPLLIISTSLNSRSRSAIMAEQARNHLAGRGRKVDWVDLRRLEPLPFCDAHSCYDHPAVVDLRSRVLQAAGIIIASPVYNYDVAASAKNLIELTGQAWNNTPVGLILAAGGQGSYMSAMPFLNSLMLDFRCPVVPRFVYATKHAFAETGELADEDVRARIHELADTVALYADRIYSPPPA